MKKFASRRPVFAPSPDALATRGAEALRLGKFKDAAEIYKQLIRDDPRPEWRGRLDEAYVGRARALAEKGLFKEARSSWRTLWRPARRCMRGCFTCRV